MQRIIVSIGSIVVCHEPAVLETVLGSCVSVCLWDERLRIGGMNHFMFPQMKKTEKDKGYYGCSSIHELIKALVKLSSEPRCLKAKIFGGGSLNKTLAQGVDIGKENVCIAKDILKKYSIPVTKEFTGQPSGIKIIFCTSTGRAFVKKLTQVR